VFEVIGMLTVREVAQRYGVSTGFVVRALAKLGFATLTPSSAMTTDAIARFEAEFGEKIRAHRPNPPPAFTAATDAAPVPAWPLHEPPPQVMRVAHAKITGKRGEAGIACKALLDDPGLVHAIDPVGTWDGDPWNGRVEPGAVHFYSGPVGSGPYAACGTAKVRAVLGDEFVPEEPEVATSRGQCPKCAQIVADGRGFRSPPQDRAYRSYFCDAYLRVRIDGRIEVQDCSLRDFHNGPHRTRDGATWDIGFDDFVPAPLDANRRITKAS
jgi:hypothetical protein